MSEDWQRPEFRQNVVAKINEAVAATSLATSRNGTEMENHVFAKARTKEEYLGFVAKLIFHVRDTKLKNQQQQQMQQMQQQQQQQQQQQNADNSGGNPGGMQDPINALQNLASHQGNRGPMQPQMMSGGGGPMNSMGNVGGPGGPGQPGGNANVLQSMIHQRPGMQQIPNMSNMQPARLGAVGVGQQMPGVVNMQQGQIAPGGGMVGGQMGMGQMSGGVQVGQGPNSGQLGGMQMGGGGLVVGNAQMANQPMNSMNNMGMMINSGMAPNQINVGGMNQQILNQNNMMNRINVGGNMNQQQQQQQLQMNQLNPNGMPQQMNQNAAGLIGGIVGQQQAQQMGGPNGIPGQMPQQQQQQQQMNAGPNMAPNQMGGAANPMNLNQMLNNMPQHMVRKPDGMLINSNVPFQSQGIRPNMPNQQQQAQAPQQQQQQQQSQQPQQYNNFRKSPSPSVPSPAGMVQPPSHPGQMVPSPAMAQSPSMVNQQQKHQNVMAPSPNASINTPGQANAAVPSPLNPTDEQQYREKYRQLTKYIEPMKRMIARIEKDGKDSTEKLLKMNKLLELLCNPSQRVSLETLLKCEVALERMDFKNNYFVAPGSQLGGASKEHPINNILLEAVNANLQSSIGNHTLQRTFRPCLEALFGPDIKNMPTPTKRRKLSEHAPDEPNPDHKLVVPHVLQGEIARLDQKFKVSLDPSTLSTGTGVIKLVCCLDDKHLPCVPPVSVVIPEDYPMASPSCKLIEQEYNSTPFLISVQSALAARVSKLPKQFSLSHLLDTWEMAVRMACAPSRVQPSATTVLLGI